MAFNALAASLIDIVQVRAGTPSFASLSLVPHLAPRAGPVGAFFFG